MNYNFIYGKILKAYRKSGVDSFPFSTKDVLHYHGYTIVPYSFLETKKKGLSEMCFQYSEDAFRFKNLIYYNDMQPKSRIDFSLMHELGHILLEHQGEYDWQETEANYFASNILAPRMAIHYARCTSPEDVHKKFKLSPEASKYAYDSYLSWIDHIKNNGNKISGIDKDLYKHFYSEKYEMFVWNKSKCRCCGKIVYNNRICECHSRRMYTYHDSDIYSIPGYVAGEYNYLYGKTL